ncbi:hypothetical protein K1719_025349 [Acacia pycnantha]|nr:hypothetical protein K1719_025349 [Acacia pycnantha]
MLAATKRTHQNKVLWLHPCRPLPDASSSSEIERFDDRWIDLRHAYRCFKNRGSFNNAHKVFEHIPNRTIPSSAALIGSHCQLERLDALFAVFDSKIAKEIFNSMLLNGVETDAVFWSKLTSGSGETALALKSLEDMQEKGFQDAFDVTIASILPACAGLKDNLGRPFHGYALKHEPGSIYHVGG